MLAKEQHANMKSPSEIRMLEEAYGKVILKKTQVFKWHRCFHDGRAACDSQL
jgi:hypothetical protein